MENWINEMLSKWATVDWGAAVATACTGMIVVFLALVSLVLIVWIFGKLMSKLTHAPKKPKEIKKESKPAPLHSAKTPVAKMAGDDLSQEVVAAITGALSVILGGENTFIIKHIKRSRTASSSWRHAGIVENTRPF